MSRTLHITDPWTLVDDTTGVGANSTLDELSAWAGTYNQRHLKDAWPEDPNDPTISRRNAQQKSNAQQKLKLLVQAAARDAIWLRKLKEETLLRLEELRNRNDGGCAKFLEETNRDLERLKEIELYNEGIKTALTSALVDNAGLGVEEQEQEEEEEEQVGPSQGRRRRRRVIPDDDDEDEGETTGGRGKRGGGRRKQRRRSTSRRRTARRTARRRTGKRVSRRKRNGR
jgi:hypothetical protein